MSRFNDYPERLRIEVVGLSDAGYVLEGVKSLTVKLDDGSSMGILPGHIPLIAATADGLLRFTDQQGQHELLLKAGILTVRNNTVSILTAY